MDIYNYHPGTKEYLGSAKADPDPLEEGNWLIPANSTSTKPTDEPGENEVLVFEDENWLLKPDFRGHEYWTPEGEHHQIKLIGELVPDNALDVEPDLSTVDEVKAEAIETVRGQHASVLNNLSGRATVEERDTWPLQKEWAKTYLDSQSVYDQNMLLGLLRPSEIQMLEAAGQDPAEHMAMNILLKSEAMDLLTSKAGGLKREADELISAAQTKEEVQEALEQLSVKMQATIQVYMEAVGV